MQIWIFSFFLGICTILVTQFRCCSSLTKPDSMSLTYSITSNISGWNCRRCCCLIGEKPCIKSVILKSLIKVCVLWLPRYFRYSIEVKRVESTGTRSDRSFTGLFTCVLTVFYILKNEKKTKNGKRKIRWKQRQKHWKEYICDFWDISKTK